MSKPALPPSATCAEAAAVYIGRGWSPTPLKHKSKIPILSDWPACKIDISDVPAYWNNGQNIGIVLGPASGCLVDIDLDAREAARAAPHFIPSGTPGFGRGGSARHFLFRITGGGCPRTEAFKDLDGETIVEIRGDGGQTMVPPSIHPEGEPIEWLGEFTDPPGITKDEVIRIGRKIAAAALLIRNWTTVGSRHDIALAVSGTLLLGGWDEEEAAGFLRAVAASAGDDEIDDRVRTVDTTARRLEHGESVTGIAMLKDRLSEKVAKLFLKFLDPLLQSDARTQPNPSWGPDQFRLTDLGNAERCVARHGSSLRYCEPWNSFLVWNDRRWMRDERGEAARWMKDTVRAIYAAAEQCSDDTRRIALAKHGQRSENAARLEAALRLVRSERGVPVLPDELDQDPWLLNVENGTIDLRTGKPRPHHQDDLITKVAPAAFDCRLSSERASILDSWMSITPGCRRRCC